MQVDVRGQLTLDEASLARIAVLEHAGIGFFLEQDVIDDIQAGRLIRLLDDWTPPSRPVSVLSGRRHPPPGWPRFWRWRGNLPSPPAVERTLCQRQNNAITATATLPAGARPQVPH